MSTFWPGVVEVVDRGFGGSRNGAKLRGMVLHHAAHPDAFDYVSNVNERNSHPTYHGNRFGEIRGVVHPNRRPYSTGPLDLIAATVELDNTGGAPDWPVSDRTLDAMVLVCAHHAVEGGYDRAEVNVPNTDQGDAFFVAWHSQYGQTECPGNFVRERVPRFVDQINRTLQRVSVPDLPQEEDMAYIRFPGAEGKRLGGVYLVLTDKNGAKEAVYLGSYVGPATDTIPLVTDEAAIERLYKSIPGFR